MVEVWASGPVAHYLERRLPEFISEAGEAHTGIGEAELWAKLVEELRNAKIEVDADNHHAVMVAWVRSMKSMFAVTLNGGFNRLGRIHLVDQIKQRFGLPADESLPEFRPPTQ